jgi:hypothetical protein
VRRDLAESKLHEKVLWFQYAVTMIYMSIPQQHIS